MAQRKVRTILQAGKQVVTVAGERMLRSGSPKLKAEDVLNDPATEPQSEMKPGGASAATKRGLEESND